METDQPRGTPDESGLLLALILRAFGAVSSYSDFCCKAAPMLNLSFFRASVKL